jgi:phenylalanyl-tRNA synthetase alpha chain
LSDDAKEKFEEALRAAETVSAQGIEGARDEQELRAQRAQLLGKEGAVAAALKWLGKLPGTEKKSAGQRVNAIKQNVESAFEARLEAIHRAARQKDLEGPPFDLSLPGRPPTGRGHLHPVTQVREDILDALQSLGFVITDAPQVELDEYNFERLGFPPDHPARDMQDTFWAENVKSTIASLDGATRGTRVLLRTHTSNSQTRELLRNKPPFAVACAGPTYRVDDDPTHTPMFHQFEGFLVDRKVSFAQLKGVLTTFIGRLFGERPVRFRPSYFPFTEPSAEVDMRCVFCEGAGCRLCKQTGWMEILGSGMIHPVVFEACGIDSEEWTGFAFGSGIDRPAMIRHGVPDLRLLFENDVRFLAQF